MLKNWKIILGLGAGFWAVMFIGVAALIVSPLPNLWQKIIEIILAGLVSFILAKFYFRKHPGDFKAGLVLAFSWLILSTVLDLLLTVQFVRGRGSYLFGLKTFYSMWSLWVSFLVIFLACALAGKTTHGGDLLVPPNSQPTTLPKI